MTNATPLGQIRIGAQGSSASAFPSHTPLRPPSLTTLLLPPPLARPSSWMPVVEDDHAPQRDRGTEERAGIFRGSAEPSRHRGQRRWHFAARQQENPSLNHQAQEQGRRLEALWLRNWHPPVRGPNGRPLLD
jgi:hypothetical protein